MLLSTQTNNILKQLYLFLIVAVTALQIWPFLHGFRLTPDDVDSHQSAINGFGQIKDFVVNYATGQGRIGHFLTTPVAVVGAYYADNTYFRVCYTLFHFATLALFIRFVSTVTRYRLGPVMFLFMLSIYPLDYFHLPPTSYPFLVSLPVFLVLGSKMTRIAVHGRWNHGLNAVSWVMGLLGCLYLETGFLLFCALTALEMSFARQLSSTSNSRIGRLWQTFRVEAHSLSIVLASLTLYFGFRLFYPSQYEGNQLPENSNVQALIRTTVGHIYGGTSFASFSRNGRDLATNLTSLSWIQLSVICFIFAAVFVVVWFECVRVADEGQKSPVRDVSRKLIALSLASAAFITLPIAAMPKYQSWCVELNSCVYHDSRLSFYFTSLLLYCVVLLLIHSLRNRQRTRQIFIVAICVSISVSSAATFLNNDRISEDMKASVQPWYRAMALACAGDHAADYPKASGGIAGLVDPTSLVMMHTGRNRESYWLSYVRHLSVNATRPCDTVAPRQVTRRTLPFGNVDAPKARAIIKGVLRVEGWALAEEPIAEIGIFIDSKFVRSFAVDRRRDDVVSAYPKVARGVKPGFATEIDTQVAGLLPGWHSLIVQAKTESGAIRDIGVVEVVIPQ